MKRYALVGGLAAQQNDETLGRATECSGAAAESLLERIEKDPQL